VVRGGETIPVHDALLPHGFTLLTGTHAAPAWRHAARHVDATLRMRVACLVVGPGPDADLRDPADAWPALSEVDRTGAVLVRPDGHVAWRTHGLPDMPGEALDAALHRLLSLTHMARAAETA
jgi:2,4-dichlorophenol 6-monooxygenase